MNLSLANARGVPMMVLLLWVGLALFIGALAFTFKGAVQV